MILEVSECFLTCPRGRAGRPRAPTRLPLGVGFLWQGVGGVARISLRLSSTTVSAGFGLLAFAAVSFYFLDLRVSSVLIVFAAASRRPFFSCAFGVGSSSVWRFRVCV